MVIPLALALLVTGAPMGGVVGGGTVPAGEGESTGFVLLTDKALVAEPNGRNVVDHAAILVKDGRIEAVLEQGDAVYPEGYEVVDVRPRWVMPGMVDLHSHVGGSRGDINDMVFQTNGGLRVTPAVVPANPALELPVAAGVTTVLFIPGSGTNMGGQGVLMKTAPELYEDAVVRDPGSLKIAQGDNPKRWGYGMGRLLMNHTLRKTIEAGLAYARDWEAFELGNREEPPARDLRLDVFRDLAARRIQVSTHTQYYQLVMMSILMLSRDYGLDAFIDHGSFDSYLNTDLAVEHDVAAILGPREVLWPAPPRYDTDGRAVGCAWGFQMEGHPIVGFNTDAPVVPQEELPLQAAMGMRFGFDGSDMQGVRGITIVPAMVAGLDGQVGSLQAGKDADLVVIDGDPADPRTSVHRVYVNGDLVYDAEETGVRKW